MTSSLDTSTQCLRGGAVRGGSKCKHCHKESKDIWIISKIENQQGIKIQTETSSPVQKVWHARLLRHPDARVHGQEAQAHQASNHHCEKVNSVSIFSPQVLSNIFLAGLRLSIWPTISWTAPTAWCCQGRLPRGITQPYASRPSPRLPLIEVYWSLIGHLVTLILASDFLYLGRGRGLHLAHCKASRQTQHWDAGFTGTSEVDVNLGSQD